MTLLEAHQPVFCLPHGRASVNKMDVVPRQSYISGIVPAEERTAAMGITNIARGVSGAFGPLITGFFISAGQFRRGLVWCLGERDKMAKSSPTLHPKSKVHQTLTPRCSPPATIGGLFSCVGQSK